MSARDDCSCPISICPVDVPCGMCAPCEVQSQAPHATPITGPSQRCISRRLPTSYQQSFLCLPLGSATAGHHILPRIGLSLGLGRVRGESEVRVDGLDVVAEKLLDLLALHRRVDNNVVALLPVLPVSMVSSPPPQGATHGRGGDLVLVAELQRVDDAQNFGKVTASAGRVGERQTDGTSRVDCR